MGWFWDDKKGPDSAENPYSKLDPALRDFLDKESPSQHQDSKPSRPHPSQASSDAAPNTYRSQLGWDAHKPSQQQPETQSDTPAVPPESLYQDGRYAHLWKDYRSLAEIDATGKSDQDRLADVVATYNDRRAAIGRAAVENCIMEQMAERDCWENGSWGERMNMCRGPNKQFLRCYTMQSRFLKALGYLNNMRTEEEEERVQMHADKLYNDMIQREQESEQARKEGREVVEPPPLIEPSSTQQALGENSAWARARQEAQALNSSNNLSSFTPERQAQIRKQVEGLSPREQELELQLIAAESRAHLEYAKQVRAALEEEQVGRLDRRARGKETVGDTIKRLWGWDKGR